MIVSIFKNKLNLSINLKIEKMKLKKLLVAATVCLFVNAAGAQALIKNGTQFGNVNATTGEVTIKGTLKGKFETNGDIKVGSTVTGKIESNGDVKKNGTIVGKIAPNGDVTKNGVIVGNVSSNGDVKKNGQLFCTARGVRMQYAAAVIFFDFFIPM